MIRFIIRRRVHDKHSDAATTHIETLDVECTALECALSRGGLGQSGYDISEIVGVEVLPTPAGEGNG